jgi:hypothetical protein
VTEFSAPTAAIVARLLHGALPDLWNDPPVCAGEPVEGGPIEQTGQRVGDVVERVARRDRVFGTHTVEVGRAGEPVSGRVVASPGRRWAR